MSSTHSSLLAHVVFSTKHREPLIEPAMAKRVYGYIGGVVRERDGVLLAAGGMADHVHLLVSCHPGVAVADLVRDVKANSSRWCRADLKWKAFAWQTGYGVFSVSESNAAKVRTYIANQEKHHRRMTFQEEYIEFLERHRVKYDPRYVWD